jgi:hypothetical protein
MWRRRLVPEVFTEAEFKRWMENAKKLLKKDGHFTIPRRRPESFELREGPVSHSEEYLAAFAGARRLKEQINALEQILKNLPEFPDAVSQLQPIIAPINETARKSQRLHTAEALSLLLSRDELIDRTPGLERGADAPLVADFLRDEQRQLPTLLGEIPAAKLRRVVSECQLPSAMAGRHRPSAWCSAEAPDWFQRLRGCSWKKVTPTNFALLSTARSASTRSRAMRWRGSQRNAPARSTNWRPCGCSARFFLRWSEINSARNAIASCTICC